jgi:predicted amidohydrolase
MKPTRVEIINPVLTTTFSVALVQKPQSFLNLPESTQWAISFIQQAANESVDLVVFPETWLPGYPVWLDYAEGAALWNHPPAKALFRLLSNNALQIEDPYYLRIKNAAVEHQLTIVIGAHERVGRSIYNTMFYFNKDGTVQLHRKLMPTYTERLIWAQGDGSTLPVIEHDKVRIGGLICWEHWMPLARAAMQSKNEHIHIAQWPMVKELHQIASKNYAFEAQAVVIAAGGILSKQHMLDGIESVAKNKEERSALDLINSMNIPTDELLLKGGSSIILPDTGYALKPHMNSDLLLFAELDLTSLPDGNLFIDGNGHYSRPDVFTLSVDTRAKTNVTFE